MTTPNQPGWYDDPHDSNAQRYWDGQEWTPHRQRKPTSRTGRPSAMQTPPPQQPPPPPPPNLPPPPPPNLPPPSVAAPGQPAPEPTLPPPPDYNAAGGGQGAGIPMQPPPPAWPPPSPQSRDAGTQMASDGLATVKGIVGRLSITAWLLIGGFVLAVIATFFPYATVSAEGLVSIEVSANAAAQAVVFVLVGVAAGLAWPALAGSQVDVWRLIGLGVVVLLLGGLMVVWFNDASANNVEGEGVDVSPGSGLLLYGAAVIVITVGVVRLWMHRLQTQKRTY